MTNPAVFEAYSRRGVVWHRPDTERAELTIDTAGKTWSVKAVKTDDGIWVATCRGLDDWSAKGSLADIETMFLDYITSQVPAAQS